jgi:hypothetical protein
MPGFYIEEGQCKNNAKGMMSLVALIMIMYLTLF